MVALVGGSLRKARRQTTTQQMRSSTRTAGVGDTRISVGYEQCRSFAAKVVASSKVIAASSVVVAVLRTKNRETGFSTSDENRATGARQTHLVGVVLTV